MFMHDIIKIKYVREGYLPNYPCHLISDDEMFEAFLGEDGYLESNFPCVNAELEDAYNELMTAIRYHIEQFKSLNKDIPDWVYSYMIGSVITTTTSETDIDYLIDLLNLEVDNNCSEFTSELSQQCYDISVAWIKKLPGDKIDHRPPTVFGEPHVIKSLRLQQVNVMN